MSEYACERIWDYQVVARTMSSMWDDIAEDDAPDYIPDVVGEYWVGIYADGIYVGMYRIHQLTSVLYEGHAFILHGQRQAHSLGSGKAIQKWALDNLADMQMMVVRVPECFKNVVAFVKSIGFKEMGFIPNSYSKNGVIGTHLYGISREEMEWQQQQP